MQLFAELQGKPVMIAFQYKHRCNLSGLPLTVDHAALDHITPISEGGAHKMSNLQWLDPRINSMKGTMNQTEFMILCEAITQKT